MLDVVDDVVAFGYIDVGRHFDVRNHEAVIFAVAVYDQIVHADNAVVGQNLCGDFVNEFFGRFSPRMGDIASLMRSMLDTMINADTAIPMMPSTLTFGLILSPATSMTIVEIKRQPLPKRRFCCLPPTL